MPPSQALYGALFAELYGALYVALHGQGELYDVVTTYRMEERPDTWCQKVIRQCNALLKQAEKVLPSTIQLTDQSIDQPTNGTTNESTN